MDAAVICTISPDELRRLVERYPVIGVNIISHLSRRLQEAERELEAMAYQRVGQRLARKLIDLAGRFGVKTMRGTLIDARLTQQELAEMIGTTRETLAHTLADFRRRGLLDSVKQHVVIRNAEELADIAGGDSEKAWTKEPRRLARLPGNESRRCAYDASWAENWGSATSPPPKLWISSPIVSAFVTCSCTIKWMSAPSGLVSVEPRMVCSLVSPTDRYAA